MPEPQTTHLDYAEEAEAAERAEAWRQAAALWRRAAECLPKHPCPRAAADRDQYLANAEACTHGRPEDNRNYHPHDRRLEAPGNATGGGADTQRISGLLPSAAVSTPRRGRPTRLWQLAIRHLRRCDRGALVNPRLPSWIKQ
jgi:hypothetical protein